MDVDQRGMESSAGYRIGMNLTPLSWRGGGMRHYVVQLIPWLLRLSAHRLVLFHGPGGLGTLGPMLRSLPLALRRRLELIAVDQWEQIYGFADRFDVYFCPLQCLVPRLLDRPTLATLADIQDQYFPQYFTRQQLDLRKQFYPTTVRSVTVLLTISEFSKRCICESYGVPAEKVIVTHLAPSDDVLGHEAAWPATLPPVPKRYLFYPANLYPHKGHELLLRTVQLLRRRDRMLGCIMTGCPATPGVDIEKLIRRYGLQGSAFWHGHLAPSALRYLYEHAAALLFPSEFEGFGMPLVEAMYCGCPVIATPQASIPEIAGEAGLLVERTPEALADAVVRVMDDPLERARLVARGRLQAEQFTSRRLGERTLAAIEVAVERFYAATTVADECISYVVEANDSGARLQQTLSSLAFELGPEDELVLLARREQLSMAARMLCDNLPNEPKYAGRSAGWIDAVTGRIVCYMRCGETLCEGASASVRRAFAEAPRQAAVGETILADHAGRLLTHRFIPIQLDAGLPLPEAPASAVFWRTDFLRRQRELLEQPNWPRAVLKRIPTEYVARLDRTIAIERQPAAAPGPPGAAPITTPAVLEAVPDGAPAVPMTRWVWAKHHVRRAARRLSPRLESWLHGVYVGKVRRRVRRQGAL